MINCIGVGYHKRNLFHGDIKPENIFFIDYDGGEMFFTTSDVGSILDLGEENE
jgi:serine/threonine protein kinase